LSLFVRGCWLVSFFFTPIYMFMLVFLVMFGPKKGSVIAYAPNWDFNFIKQISLVNFKTLNSQFSVLNYSFKFQFTCITSRLTTYFLFSFWLFFFFFGELLLLIMFNYVSTVDSITGNSFVVIKQHMIFYLTTIPVKLSVHINTYIFFLTSCAFFYMINFVYSYSYRYIALASLNNFLISSLLLTSIIFTFFTNSFIIFMFFIIVSILSLL
jgi:hypothetical protein